MKNKFRLYKAKYYAPAAFLNSWILETDSRDDMDKFIEDIKDEGYYFLHDMSRKIVLKEFKIPA